MSLLTKIGSMFRGPSPVQAAQDRTGEILKALGGAENLSEVDACITSLRTTLKDATRLNEERLKVLGATAIVKSGNKIQIVLGAESDHIREEIEKQMLLVKGTSVRQ